VFLLELSNGAAKQGKEAGKEESQNIGFSFSFLRPPTMEHQKGKCNQV